MQSESEVKIDQLTVQAVRVPMTEPHRTAGGVITESPLVLIDIRTDAGSVGRSIVFTYTAAALKPTAELVLGMAPLIEGETLAPAAIEQQLARRFRLLGTQGLVGMALAGIDMALWDALAQTQQLPLLRLLGGREQPLRAYGAVGFDGVEGSVKVAESWAKSGFGGIKAKIGYATVQEDLAVIRAMRDAVGDDMAIMVDYNQSLAPTDAIERLRVIDGEGLTWIEEPTLAHDYQGHARIAEAIGTPIQCGENWWGPLDMQHAIAAGACDYLMPDVMKIGGVSGWLRAAALAQVHGLRVSSHLWPEISAHLLCCTPTAHWLEYADWWNPVLERPIRVEQGKVMTDGAPGCGLSWKQDAVSRFAI